MIKTAILVPLAATFLVAGCIDNGPGSRMMGARTTGDNCATVPKERLAVPQTSGGMAIVCNPNEINPAYVDEYFQNGRAIDPT